MEQSHTYKPEASGFAHCQNLFNQIYQLSQDILSLSTGENFAQLNHCVLLRGLLVEECQRLPMESFTENEKQIITSNIALCRSLDERIEAQMKHFQQNTQRQLQHVNQSKETLKKYQHSEEQNEGFHSQDI